MLSWTYFIISDNSICRTSREIELIAELRREIRAAQSAVAAVDDAVAGRLGVNATDHRCLDILDQRGPMTAGALAEALGLSRSAVTTVLDRLEQRRYVRRGPNPDDRRQVVVALTPLLYRRARELYGDGNEVVARLGRYSVDDLALLRDFVRCGPGAKRRPCPPPRSGARRSEREARGRAKGCGELRGAGAPTNSRGPRPSSHTLGRLIGAASPITSCARTRARLAS